MTAKNSARVFNWLSVIITTILIVGLWFLIKEGPIGRISPSSGNMDIDSHIDISIIPFPGFVPNQKDESVTIPFSAPRGMIEDEEAERKIGVYKVFKSEDAKQVNPESYIVILFFKKTEAIPDLENFVFGAALNLKTLYPNQKLGIGILHLNKDAVKKFEDMGIPYYANLFFTKDENDKPGYNCAMFSFETPDGFWSINWLAPRKILERNGRERSIFLGLIKFMTIGIYNPVTKSLEIHM